MTTSNDTKAETERIIERTRRQKDEIVAAACIWAAVQAIQQAHPDPAVDEDEAKYRARLVAAVDAYLADTEDDTEADR